MFVETGLKTSSHLRVRIEAHREPSGARNLSVLALKMSRVSRPTALNVRDTSSDFNPLPIDVEDFAYDADFTVPCDFDGGEEVFETLVRLGFVRNEVLAAMRMARAEMRDANTLTVTYL